MNKKGHRHILQIVLSIVLIMSTLSMCILPANAADIVSGTRAAALSDGYVYLSDLQHEKSMSSYGYRELVNDKNLAGTDLTVKIENSVLTMPKGVFAHAPYNLIYNIGDLNYDYFTAFLGVNTTAGGRGDGVKFYIYTSLDGTNWDLKTDAEPKVMKSTDSAEYVKVDIAGAKYLRIFISQLGGNGSDHSVLADAKLVGADYTDELDCVKPLEDYDELIRNQLGEKTEFTGDDELLLLQREFVNRAGRHTLQFFAKEKAENQDVIKWLMNDLDSLRYYLLGGAPSGSYTKSLTVLGNLLAAHKEDMNDTTVTASGCTRGDLFKRMMITLSLTHAETVRLWLNDKSEDGKANLPKDDPNSPNVSDPVRRYEVYKKMYLAGKLSNAFERLEVEEMRLVMNSSMSDYEIEWLRDYIFKRSNGSFGYNNSWVAYLRNHYYTDNLYDESKKDAYNTKYNDFLSYSIKYKKYYPSLWMPFEVGGICWQIANTGANAFQSYGLPSIPVSQPGHLAYMVYSQNASGNGGWSIWNSGYPWAKTNFTGYDEVRYYFSQRPLNGWGQGSYASKQNGSYIWLSQAAINDYANYVKSQKLVMLANSYAGDYGKQEEIYRAAIGVQKINFDAWLQLAYTYVANEAKTQQNYYDFEKEIIKNFSSHPTVLYDLLGIIEPCITDEQWSIEATILKTSTFQRLARSGNVDIQKIAQEILGDVVDEPVASFSFDGEYAGQIRLSHMFSENNLPKWEYSIDGGRTYIEANGMFVQLTDEQLSKIHQDNDVKVHIIGLPASGSSTYTIDITGDLSMPSNLYENDLDNRVMGVTDAMEWYKRADENWIEHDLHPMDTSGGKGTYEYREIVLGSGKYEWRYTKGDVWVSYKDGLPDMTGNTSVKIRMAPSGTQLPADHRVYNFTEDNLPSTRKYVPVSSLSVHEVSSETTANPAVNSIDGHTSAYQSNSTWYDWSKWLSMSNDTERYIILKTAYPIFLSSLEYIPSVQQTGRIIDGKVYGSMDGENWTEIASMTNLANNDAVKVIDIENPMELQYIKVVGTRTQGGNVISARHFNVFQNTELTSELYANLTYSTKSLTNQDVVVRVIDVTSSNVVFDSEGGDKHVFTENGTHEFKFHDPETGKTGSVTATVDWIDKVAPVGTVQYSTTEPTNGMVTATVTPEEGAIVFNDNLDPDNEMLNPSEYIFMENGEYAFQLKDAAGNIGTVTAKVDWIDTEPPVADIQYDITTFTNKSVTATVCDMNEEVTVLNNGGSFSYTFEDNGSFEFIISDKAGNTSTLVASVDWIHDCSTKGHKDTVVDLPADCFNFARTQRICQVCGNVRTYNNYSYPPRHSYSAEWTIDVAPTCTADGSKSHQCTACGRKKDVTAIPMLGHSYEETVTKPTCTDKGYTTHTCANCGDSFVDSEIAALGHSYAISKITAPNCTDKGYTTHTCATCGDSYNDSETAALGHSYKTKVTAPNCTDKGYTTHTCANCGDSYNDNETAALGHSYKTKVTAPTCTEKGYTTHTCSTCGDTFTDSETAALGHSYKSKVTAPTCTTKGYTAHTCSACGHTFADSDTPALGHSYKTKVTAPTCTEKGYTTHTCSRCGDKFVDSKTPALGHSYTSKVTKEANCTESGVKTFKCSRCGKSHTELIPALGHKDADDNGICDICGAGGVSADDPNEFRCDKCDKYDELKASGSPILVVYWLVHLITHFVQWIHSITAV